MPIQERGFAKTEERASNSPTPLKISTAKIIPTIGQDLEYDPDAALGPGDELLIDIHFLTSP